MANVKPQNIPEPGTVCKFFISIEEPECGREAVALITTRITKEDQAKVPLCAKHKRMYDRKMADRRTHSVRRVG